MRMPPEAERWMSFSAEAGQGALHRAVRIAPVGQAGGDVLAPPPVVDVHVARFDCTARLARAGGDPDPAQLMAWHGMV